jgi:hypothetical protein
MPKSLIPSSSLLLSTHNRDSCFSPQKNKIRFQLKTQKEIKNRKGKQRDEEGMHGVMEISYPFHPSG